MKNEKILKTGTIKKLVNPKFGGHTSKERKEKGSKKIDKFEQMDGQTNTLKKKVSKEQIKRGSCREPQLSTSKRDFGFYLNMIIYLLGCILTVTKILL